MSDGSLNQMSQVQAVAYDVMVLWTNVTGPESVPNVSVSLVLKPTGPTQLRRGR